ncbi:MAG: terminase small subunit [Alphaproteobacteria bacterium]|jgi:hypothetical protein|nr:terminase small subunit [Alphaproteobacteria bacterium]
MPATLPALKPPDSPPEAPKPLRSRHEAFCQYFVLGGNATYAAINAGYTRKWSRNQGYRLMRQPAIQARIAAIRSTLARVYCLDPDVLLGKLEAVYQRAHENHHFHAAARAVEIQSRIARQAHPQAKAPPATFEDGRSPDRDAKMTTNDDILRPGTDGFAVDSMVYTKNAMQK